MAWGTPSKSLKRPEVRIKPTVGETGKSGTGKATGQWKARLPKDDWHGKTVKE